MGSFFALSAKHNIKRITLMGHVMEKYLGPLEKLRDYILEDIFEEFQIITFPLNRESLQQRSIQTYFFDKESTNKIKKRYIKPPFSLLFDMLSIFNRGKSPNIVINFNIFCALISIFKFKKNTFKVLYNVDTFDSRFKNRFLNKLIFIIEKYIYNKMNLIIETNDLVLEKKIRNGLILKSKSYVAGISYSKKLFPKFEKLIVEKFNKKTLVYFGRIDERNGIKFLVELIKIIKEKKIKLKFIIIGDGPLAGYLKNQIKNFDLNDFVDYRGYIFDLKEVFDLISEQTLAIAPFVNFSKTNYTQNADPGKLKAYKICGLPVVTSSIPNILRSPSGQHKDCLIIQNYDYDEWVHSICGILDNFENYKDLVNFSIKTRNDYADEKIFKDMMDFLQTEYHIFSMKTTC